MSHSKDSAHKHLTRYLGKQGGSLTGAGDFSSRLTLRSRVLTDIWTVASRENNTSAKQYSKLDGVKAHDYACVNVVRKEGDANQHGKGVCAWSMDLGEVGRAH